MNNILDVLKRVRNESKHIVDKSTLNDLDKAIKSIEEEIEGKNSGKSPLKVISYAVKILSLIKYLTGDSSD
ncbi:TPA: hypothetical protein ACKRC9_000352 [Proteus mirabilis]|nr:hypothetical protein [Proteus mirabilis]HEJ9686586.1 hypothetical protein [Proteus mirabilis]